MKHVLQFVCPLVRCPLRSFGVGGFNGRCSVPTVPLVPHEIFFFCSANTLYSCPLVLCLCLWFVVLGRKRKKEKVRKVKEEEKTFNNTTTALSEL